MPFVQVLDEAFEVLSQQLDAIRGLQDLLSRDEKDLAVLGEELARDTAGSRRALR